MITELTNKDKTGNKWRESLFLVTINSNKSMNCKNGSCSHEQLLAIKDRLHKLLEGLFTKKNIIKHLIFDLGRPKDKKEKIIIDPVNVKDVIIKSQIEIQEENRGFIHSHTLIKIIHNTRIHLNLAKIKEVTYEFMRHVLTFDNKFSKPYINVRAKKSEDFNLSQYVSPDY